MPSLITSLDIADRDLTLPLRSLLILPNLSALTPARAVATAEVMIKSKATLESSESHLSMEFMDLTQSFTDLRDLMVSRDLMVPELTSKESKVSAVFRDSMGSKVLVA